MKIKLPSDVGAWIRTFAAIIAILVFYSKDIPYLRAYLLIIAPALAVLVIIVTTLFVHRSAVKNTFKRVGGYIAKKCRDILSFFSNGSLNTTATKAAVRKMYSYIIAKASMLDIPRIIVAIILAIIIVLGFVSDHFKVLTIGTIGYLFLFTPVCSLIARLIKKIITKSKVAIYILKRHVAIISTATLIMTILIFSLIKDLPDAKKVKQTVRKMGNNITAKNMASFSSNMDNIIHTIIGYQKTPDATRNRVYEDALRQAADKGYIFYIPQKNYYITAINKRGDNCLLTEEERNRIVNSLDDIFKRSDKREQISLTNMVLSDIRVTEELWKPKKRLVELSELDIVGIVGGYIGELVLKY